MADWFFSPDDDNLLMGAGGLLKAFDDRLYFMALMTNGSESNFAASQMDDYLGFNGGLWYDFGGTYDEARKAWQLYGDSTGDIDYSPCPVVRVGAGANITPWTAASSTATPSRAASARPSAARASSTSSTAAGCPAPG